MRNTPYVSAAELEPVTPLDTVHLSVAMHELVDSAPTSIVRIDPIAAINSPNQLWLSAKHDSSRVGFVAIQGISWPDRLADVALIIDSTLRNMGFGGYILRGVEEYARKVLNLRRLTAHILESNVASLKLAKRMDYSLEGTLKGARYRNGAYEDVHIHAKILA